MKIGRLQSIFMDWSATNLAGFSLVEVILVSTLFVLIVVALGGNFIYSRESTALAGDRTRAVMIAQEGLEAVRNIRDADFASLIDGTHGLVTSTNEWILSGSSSNIGIYNRSIVISTIDANTKQVLSQVTWQQNAQRQGSINLKTYLTNWQETFVGDPYAACIDYCNDQGRTQGTCRQNDKQCEKNNEVYIPGGDYTCSLLGPSGDTCCCSLF